MSSFLDRKLTRRFQTYDLDRDGLVDAADFERACANLGAEYGLPDTDPGLRRLRELMGGLWRHLAAAADTDGDGRIDLAEYKRAFTAGLLETPENFDRVYVPFLDALMAIADTDGDGRLSAEDEVRWTRGLMALPDATGRDVHRRLDTDEDGYIGTAELLSAIREFYFDDSQGSAGEFLLGPLPE
ncbi:calcium binding protein [Actinokineospora spheciospongiae]|uniref:Calcium binding protein n=1 Tax=Actinokineospora spheciospongiae TaxID=909613 RepID=W7J863_9PSEU|nr:EF-hand domain-containing protein [Actinokineospora spheciospongiae]EWC62204.1 calcium binding protein [Actinokineospora spheciospongiae]PWW62500.1 EF hand domain-containing protein [Actinokineospora spheciospongiae]